MKCKVSGKNIKPFMNFGKMPMANGFIEKKNFKNEFFYNLEVGFCEYNYLFQVNDHPKSQKIFNNKYPFYTGKSKFMRDHFKNYFLWAQKNYLKDNSKIIEIGSNDGTFLSNFKEKNYEHCGFEPSKNVADVSKKLNLKVINNFFNYKNSSKLKKFKSNTDLICAANVISHIPNLNDLIKGIELLLSKNGVFVFEEPYLGSMFKKTSYDQIYDAHVFMFSLLSVREIFKKFDLELIDACPQITHGGSMRYVIGRKKNREVSKRIKLLIQKELSMNLNNIKSCIKFKNNCEESKEKFKNKLINLKKKGYKICGYAAAAKSTTLLNYCNINNNFIDYIADSTSEKIGKFSPGMHIPIVSIDYFRKNPPDIAVLFSWNHKNEILEKEKNFAKKGGKWLWHTQ
jgi:methylation protein EvaC